MRRISLCCAPLVALFWTLGGTAFAVGPTGSTECHIQDDDCDGAIDEDPAGDADGDGVLDDDGDGLVDEDAAGDAADDPGENQVDCSDGSQSVGGVAYVSGGSGGAEVCADNTSSAPVDGRVIVDADEGYVAADGDQDNPAPLNGYVRADEQGFHCGDENNQDSTADQSSNTSEDCG